MTVLGAVYGRVAGFRRAWYERHPSAQRQLTRPVISVGNLVVGGSGKTPLVAALARLLIALGYKPAVLSRGYARRQMDDGVVVVSDGERVCVPVEVSGDEPQMLARQLSGVPVLVSPDRYLAGMLAERRFGATVILLDDGFQHLQLSRSIDLLLIAPEDMTEDLLPWGRLREPLTAGGCADAVVTYGTQAQSAQIAQTLGVPDAFTLTVAYRPLEALRGDAGAVNAARVLAVAAIARPRRFFDALRLQGYEIAREMTFRDHHWFSAADVQRINTAAHEAGAHLIVTTEKDGARLAVADHGAGVPWAVLPMDVSIEPAELFTPWLQQRL